jgi:hypothetical protein
VASSGVSVAEPADVAAFEQWRRRRADRVHVFLPQTTWTDIEAPDWWLTRWAPFASRLLVSVPMWPNGSGATFALGAAGAYDAHYAALGRRLTAAGAGNALIRPGWEFNGPWSSWYAKDDPRGYADYFARIRSAMKAASAGFKFVWCPSANGYGWDPNTAYPGDGRCAYIGLDQYDVWNNHPNATPQQRWDRLLAQPGPGGLAYWAKFASTHGKRLWMCEWGLWGRDESQAGGGGGDNPFYVESMLSAFEAFGFAGECYFNRDARDGKHRLDLGGFPQAAARYRALFGAT